MIFAVPAVVAVPAFAAGLAAAVLGKSRLLKKGAPKANSDFHLWPELAEGKVEVTRYELCQVLLVDDSNYPTWLVLVPQKNGLTEVIDLPEREQHLLWTEVARASRALKTCFSQAPHQSTQHKLNIAAIGNMVSQLHVHITLRSPADPAWPGPCYGAVAPKPFSPVARDELLQKLRAIL